MRKKDKIIYWIVTAWLALGMFSTGIVQLLHHPDETKRFLQLGYPPYLMTIIGVCKILGVAAVLVPGFPRLSEWAYAGFFFTMAGAVVSHLVSGTGADVWPALLLLALTLLSWYYRPAVNLYRSTNKKTGGR